MDRGCPEHRCTRAAQNKVGACEDASKQSGQARTRGNAGLLPSGHPCCTAGTAQRDTHQHRDQTRRWAAAHEPMCQGLACSWHILMSVSSDSSGRTNRYAAQGNAPRHALTSSSARSQANSVPTFVRVECHVLSEHVLSRIRNLHSQISRATRVSGAQHAARTASRTGRTFMFSSNACVDESNSALSASPFTTSSAGTSSCIFSLNEFRFTV